MFFKQVISGQLYVYHRGVLIYKRWIWKGFGQVFHYPIDTRGKV